MDDRLALNVAKVGEMSKELKGILYKEFRSNFKVKPHVIEYKNKVNETDISPYADVNLEPKMIDYYMTCAKAFLILSGKNPMNYSIWYDLLNLSISH